MSSEELCPIAEMILHHHERWDGNGYPSKLAKDEIPVLSRIISIVDAYDAMVNNQFAKSDIAYLRHPILRKDGKVISVICNGERYYDSSVKAFRSTIQMFELE